MTAVAVKMGVTWWIGGQFAEIKVWDAQHGGGDKEVRL